MGNLILETISHIKNVSKKSATAEKNLNHIFKISASNIDLKFVNETIKQLISKSGTEILINPLMKYRLTNSMRP